MREIKFRAWINKEEMQSDDGFMHMPNDTSDFELVSNGNGGFALVANYESWVDESKFEVMQYTGLKDANGVEIYEGDIIETSGLEFSREVVKHKVDNSIQTSGHGCSDTKATSGYSIGGYYGGPDKIEVIGNIHENPELLP